MLGLRPATSIPELDKLAADLNTKLEQAGSGVSAKGTVKSDL